MGETPNRLTIEGVTVSRNNFLSRRAAGDYEPGEAVTPGELAGYVAGVIARRRGEEVVTLRQDSTSVSGTDAQGRHVVDGWLYQLTTGQRDRRGGSGVLSSYTINYREKWFTVTAADLEVAQRWAGAAPV